MKHLALVIALFVASPLMADDVADLIQQLDADTFVDREKATTKLQEMGKDVIPALTEAADGKVLETMVRSIGILKNLTESEDKATAEAARSALEKLSQSKNASVARRAKTALTPQPNPVPNNNRLPPAGIRINGAILNGVRRLTTRTVNGVKTIEATEANRKVKIVDDPGKGITVEITETKNGKETTEKFEAKNADDFKKKHPKAYEDYDKYRQAGQGRIRFGVGRAGVPPRPVVPNNVLQRINGNRLELVGRIMQSMSRQLDALTNDQMIKDADNKSRENLKNQIGDLKKQLEGLEKKLDAANQANPKAAAPQEKPANE